MELRIAFIGFGHVARRFARILNDRKTQLDRDHRLRWRATAIATARHGCITGGALDLLEAAARVEAGADLATIEGSTAISDTEALIEAGDFDVLFETTPLNINDGEPATGYIRNSLVRGASVITANKGPIAFSYSELKALAAECGGSFRFEGTVMDGAPVFNLVERCLPSTRVLSFSGVLNSTTNLILTGMESGRSFQDSLAEAQACGIAEANADHDIDGWDSAMKAVALANVWMNAEAHPHDVERVGIRDVTAETVMAAAASGAAVRLVSRGRLTGGGVKLTVSPETLPLASTLGAVRGTSNALVIHTDLMGELAVVETDPGVDQTAYALLSDLLAVHQALDKKRTM